MAISAEVHGQISELLSGSTAGGVVMAKGNARKQDSVSGDRSPKSHVRSPDQSIAGVPLLDIRSTDLQRLRTLAELDIYEKVLGRLEVWGKRRFWIVSAIIAVSLAGTGATAITAMLSGTREDAVKAKVEAEQAAIAVRKSEKAATDAETVAVKSLEAITVVQADVQSTRRVADESLTNARSAAAEAAKATLIAANLKSGVEETVSEARAAIAEASERANRAESRIVELEANIDTLARESEALASENRRLKSELGEASAQLRGEIDGLLAEVRAFREEANLKDETLQMHITRLGSSEALSIRTMAAIALGQRGGDAKSAIEPLKKAFDELAPADPDSPEYRLAKAAATAICQIGGDAELAYFLPVLKDKEASLARAMAAAKGLGGVGVWSKKQIGILRTSYDEIDPIRRGYVIGAVGWGTSVFEDREAKSEFLDLLTHALADESPDIVLAAAEAIGERFGSIDGHAALEALEAAAKRLEKNEVDRASIRRVLEKLRGRKKS